MKVSTLNRNLKGVRLTSDIFYLKSMNWQKVTYTLACLWDYLEQLRTEEKPLRVEFWQTQKCKGNQHRVLTINSLEVLIEGELEVRDVAIRGNVPVDTIYLSNPDKLLTPQGIIEERIQPVQGSEQFRRMYRDED